MKEENNQIFFWILFSVVSVIVPVTFSMILCSYINGKPIDMLDISNNVILMLLSIICSVLSISYETNSQKKNTDTTYVFYFCIFMLSITWTFYIVFLTNNIPIGIIQILYYTFFIILCVWLGILTVKVNIKNKKEKIETMRINCSIIRDKLLSEKCNKKLQPHTIREYDLLCNPDEFDRVKMVIDDYIENEG